jgi:hypothetical protein
VAESFALHAGVPRSLQFYRKGRALAQRWLPVFALPLRRVQDQSCVADGIAKRLAIHLSISIRPCPPAPLARKERGTRHDVRMGHPTQGLKPGIFTALCGTTEVVPFPKVSPLLILTPPRRQKTLLRFTNSLLRASLLCVWIEESFFRRLT